MIQGLEQIIKHVRDNLGLYGLAATFLCIPLYVFLTRFFSRPRLKAKLYLKGDEGFIGVTMKGDGQRDVHRAVSFRSVPDRSRENRSKVALMQAYHDPRVSPLADIVVGTNHRVLRRGESVRLMIREKAVFSLAEKIIIQGFNGQDLKELSWYQVWRLKYWEARRWDNLPWWHFFGLRNWQQKPPKDHPKNQT